jgi:hypothetical protein
MELWYGSDGCHKAMRTVHAADPVWASRNVLMPVPSIEGAAWTSYWLVVDCCHT